MIKKTLPLFLFLQFLSFSIASGAYASPWAANPTYLSKTGGKISYGLKNSLLGWTTMFIEAKQPKYSRDWEGFCVGISRSIFNTAAGLVQLATFPVPVDFPDVGPGVHIPTPEVIQGGSSQFADKQMPADAQPMSDEEVREAAMAQALSAAKP